MLQPATLLKLTLLNGCFSRVLNCTNATKVLSYWTFFPIFRLYRMHALISRISPEALVIRSLLEFYLLLFVAMLFLLNGLLIILSCEGV